MDDRKLALISNPIQLINQTLSSCIEHNAQSSQSLRQLLNLHEEKLKNCYDPYSSRSSSSRDIIRRGNVTLKDGQVVTLSEQRKENVIRISDAFDLDEVEALVFWLQFLNVLSKSTPDQDGPDQPESDQASAEQAMDEEMMSRFAAFYFEERRSALIVVESMLHIEDNEASPVFSVCVEVLNSIISQETPCAMLKSFTKRTKAVLPEGVRGSPRQTAFWTQQLLYEQKLLLEVVFLLFYGRMKPNAKHYLSALTVLKDTSWGQSQGCLAYFDEETSAINLNVSNLLTLITLQASHTEDICSHDFCLAPEPAPEHVLTNATRLKEIYELQLELLQRQPQRAAPIALAWTFILHKLTSVYSENGIPLSHVGFAELILPANPSLNSPSQDDEAITDQSEDTVPLYQRWFRHILSHECQLFPHLSHLATSVYCASSHNRFGAPDNNALGYLVTVRGLLSAIPMFFRLSYLNAQQFEEAINVFGLLFRLDVQHAIAGEFWKAVRGELADVSDIDISLATSEAEYLAAARSRFPANFALFTKMCRSLSGFSETRHLINPGAQAFCAESLVEYADQLVTLTEAISSPHPQVLPLTFEPTVPPSGVDLQDENPSDNQGWVKATRPVWISPGIQIPKGTVGKVVSGIDQKPVVVCWRFTWSAWEYWGSLVLHYAGYPVQHGPQNPDDDVFGSASSSNAPWAEGRLQVDGIADILEMLTSVLESRPELGSDLIRKMAGNTSHRGFIQAVFTIIENSNDIAAHTLHSEVTKSSLRLVSALLPTFSGAVWTLVRGSQLLFPTVSKQAAWNALESIGPTLKFERLSGEYGVTLAILDLAHMLVLEATTSGLTTDQTFADVKTEVLLRALNWISEEIWPGFQNWKYRQLEDKFKIASKCSMVFNMIASDALKTQLYSHDLKTDLVAYRITQCFSKWFLTSPTAITLNPMISIITTDKSVMDVLRRSSRNVELEALVESLSGCLSLARNILALRTSHLPADQPSLLERLLLASSYRKPSSSPGTKDTSRSTALPFIAQWCLDGPNTEIAKNACDIFSLLCHLSKDWPSDWSSISLGFGDPADMNRFLHDVARRGSFANDTTDNDMRSTLWNLLAVILDTQPSLAAILVTGTTFLPGSTSQPTSTSKAKTPFELGIKFFMKCFEQDDKLDIPVGQSVLYFLYTVYSHVNGFESLLNATMEDQAFVNRIVNIATSQIITPQSLLELSRNRLSPMDTDEFTEDLFGTAEEFEVKHFCHELICKAHSTRILTVLLQLEADQSTDTKGKSTKRTIEKVVLDELQKTPERLSELISSAIDSIADPELQSEALKEIMNRYSNLDLDTYRRVDSVLPYEKLRFYGKGFVYDYELMRSRVEGGDVKVADEVLKNLVAINWNLSAVDAQLEVTLSWQALLEVAFQLKHATMQLGNQLSKTLLMSASKIAEERRGGDFMVNIHSLRISMLLIMLQALPVTEETVPTTIRLLENVKNLVSSEQFPIVDSIKQKLKITWHTNFLKLLYLILRRCALIDMFKLSNEERHLMVNLVETLLRSSISILETVLTLALLTFDAGYEQDLNLSVSIFSELMKSPVRPPIMNWAHRIHDLCQPAFNLLTQEVVPDDQDPKFSEHIIRLFMSLALDDRLAEYLASEGLMPVLLNISLTHRASQGLIEPVSTNRPFERNPVHRLWCSILALVTSLANTLCYSEIFMLDEIGSFARLYSPQLLQALGAISAPDHMSRGAYGMSLTMAGIEEAELVTDLLTVISSKPIGHPLLSLPESFRSAMLTALQTLAHCLNHPHSTSKWLENDVSWKSGRLMSQSLNRPASQDQVVIDNGQNLAGHVQEALLHMLQISRNILQTLISHTRALNVLTQDVAAWAMEYAVVNPTRSIVAGDPATVGTLFELVETSLDIYRLAGNQQAGPSTSTNQTDPGQISVQNVSASVLECSLLLASTQLALWLYSSLCNSGSPTIPGMHQGASVVRDSDMGGQGAGTGYHSSTLRLKREILSDFAPDLVASIDKALSTAKSVSTRASISNLGESRRVMANFRQSVSSKKKKPFVLAASVMSVDSSEMGRGDGVKKNGVEDMLGVLKTFVERFLSGS